jgi:hypothetical protein
MSFVEVNLFGVYVAPISVIMVAGWQWPLCAGWPPVLACCAMSGIRIF